MSTMSVTPESVAAKQAARSFQELDNILSHMQSYSTKETAGKQHQRTSADGGPASNHQTKTESLGNREGKVHRDTIIREPTSPFTKFVKGKTTRRKASQNKPETRNIRMVVVEKQGEPPKWVNGEQVTYTRPNEVRVEIEAASYYPIEYTKLIGDFPGTHFPHTPGADAIGKVSEAGLHVSTFKPGDRVVVVNSRSTHCESIVVQPDQLIKVPDQLNQLDAETIAATFVVWVKAFRVRNLIVEKMGAQPEQQSIAFFGVGGWAFEHALRTLVGDDSPLYFCKPEENSNIDIVLFSTNQNTSQLRDALRCTKDGGMLIMYDLHCVPRVPATGRLLPFRRVWRGFHRVGLAVALARDEIRKLYCLNGCKQPIERYLSRVEVMVVGNPWERDWNSQQGREKYANDLDALFEEIGIEQMQNLIKDSTIVLESNNDTVLCEWMRSCASLRLMPDDEKAKYTRILRISAAGNYEQRARANLNVEGNRSTHIRAKSTAPDEEISPNESRSFRVSISEAPASKGHISKGREVVVS